MYIVQHKDKQVHQIKQFPIQAGHLIHSMLFEIPKAKKKEKTYPAFTTFMHTYWHLA